jgi:hypothetical protein
MTGLLFGMRKLCFYGSVSQLNTLIVSKTGSPATTFDIEKSFAT